MKQTLRKIYTFLFRTKIITQRNKPHVQILYFNKKHGQINSEDASPFKFNGCVLDDDKTLRKIQLLGGGHSSAITLPDGWLKTVSHEGYVKGKLVVEEKTQEVCIVVYKPKPEEVMMKA